MPVRYVVPLLIVLFALLRFLQFGRDPQCTLDAELQENDVMWLRSQADSYHLTLRYCSLRRYSAAVARKCLRDRRVLFLGDSVTRYQYLSLAYFLATGTWGNHVELVDYHKWSTYADYFKATNSWFSQELCDCFRADFNISSLRTASENRYYYGDGAFVVYIRLLSDAYPPRGHFGFPPFVAPSSEVCQAGECSKPHDWVAPISCYLVNETCKEFWIHVLRPLNITHFFFNQGHWVRTSTRDANWFRHVMQGAKAFISKCGTAYFKTTSTARKDNQRDSKAIITAREYGWKIYDVEILTRGLLKLHDGFPGFDRVHYYPFVYRELNNYLLNLLCNE